jgi:hypothetical protein
MPYKAGTAAITTTAATKEQVTGQPRAVLRTPATDTA